MLPRLRPRPGSTQPCSTTPCPGTRPRSAGGRDDEFGRAPATLAPLIAPLYAIQMTPGIATASGGPRRDAQARVLRAGGAPIPGLFAAGAAGSIWGHLTEHGGGLTDAIVFGRIAGRNCASASAVAVALSPSNHA